MIVIDDDPDAFHSFAQSKNTESHYSKSVEKFLPLAL